MSTLYLAVTLCKPATLSTNVESLEFNDGLVTLNSQRNSDTDPNVSVAFLMQDSSKEEKEYFQLWKMAVCEVILAVCALQPSLGIQQSSVVSVYSDEGVECVVEKGVVFHSYLRIHLHVCVTLIIQF